MAGLMPKFITLPEKNPTDSGRFTATSAVWARWNRRFRIDREACYGIMAFAMMREWITVLSAKQETER